MVAEVGLDGVEPLRNPGVDPVLAEVVVDGMRAEVAHGAPIIGRGAEDLYRPFGLSALSGRMVLRASASVPLQAMNACFCPATQKRGTIT